jgi:drug/metabolite transporter (DMT)-like permease
MKVAEINKSTGLSPKTTGVLMVALGAIGFASKAVIAKGMYSYGLDAITVLSLRMIFSIPPIIVLIFFYTDRHKLLNIRPVDWQRMAILGFLGYYLSSWLDFVGLQYISAGLERLILFIYPTIVVFMSALVFKKPIKKIQIYALLLTYAGIGLAMSNDIGIKNENFIWGALCVFASACTYSAFLLGSEKVIPKFGSVLFGSWAMLIATILMLLHFRLTSRVDLTGFTWEIYGLSFLMAAIATVIPIVLTAEGIRRIGANNMAIIGNIGPVSTIFLAYIFLGEPFFLMQFFGTALVIGGIVLIGRSKQ